MLYRREIGVGKAWKKAFLEFEGADQRCRVFVNGKEIGEHNGAYARFRFPVPEAALKSGELRIEALLDNRVSADVSPNFGDFTIFGGLYRNVNLLVTSEDHFDYCYYGTDGVIARAAVQDDGSGLLALEPHVCTEREDACILYTLTGPEGELAAESTAPAKESVSLRVPEPKLWNGKKAPELYTLRAELQIDGETADEAEIRVGFRTVSMSPDDGLRLNGEHIKLCGVAKHQDRAGVFSAVSREQIDEDLHIGIRITSISRLFTSFTMMEQMLLRHTMMLRLVQSQDAVLLQQLLRQLRMTDSMMSMLTSALQMLHLS